MSMAASSHLEDAAPVSAEAAVGSPGEAPADFSVEPVPLPLLHGDVAGECVQEVDVAV